MSINSQLDQLFRSLENTTSTLETDLGATENQKYSHNAFIASLELNKLGINVDHARGLLLQLESHSHHTPSNRSYRSRLKHLNDRIQRLGHDLREIERKEQEQAKKDLEELNHQQDASLVSELKQRRPSHVQQGDRGISSGLSMESKLAVQQTTQEEMSHDILGLVQKMKQNAITFAEKVAQDAGVVESTSQALGSSSTNMTKVGSKLSRYHSTTALGWRFYIMAIAFMVIALVFGMVIIRLFPKWG
ncbi:protein transport protein Use1p [Trichomonascus vanleenenianus]|uniref:SNAP receptor USE1 n=1 Tax=Trichomonascus vanleenenianus TaxID=2268995 RepID=UPI003ECA9F8D